MIDIQPGSKYRIMNIDNSFYGMILTVSHFELNNQVVRFSDAPFENFGAGIKYFLDYYEKVDLDNERTI